VLPYSINCTQLTEFTKLTQSRLVQPINLTESVTNWTITSDSYKQYIQNLNNREPAGPTKPFTANVSNRLPNYPRQANTGYAAPRAEAINLKHQTKTEFGLPYPQCLPGPMKIRGPQNSPSSRPVDLGFDVDATENKSRVTSVKTRRQNETSVDYLLRSPSTHISQWTDDSLARVEKSRSF